MVRETGLLTEIKLYASFFFSFFFFLHEEIFKNKVKKSNLLQVTLPH